MFIHFRQFQYIFVLPINENKHIRQKLNDLIPIKLQIILLNEGSLTKILNYTNIKPVTLKKSQKTNETLKNYRYLRYIYIENCLYTKLIFARSLWQFKYKNYKTKQKELENYLPVGISILKYNIDIYKQIHEIYYGYCVQLENKLNCNQPLWARKYTLSYNHESFITIQEFFSPHIINFLAN